MSEDEPSPWGKLMKTSAFGVSGDLMHSDFNITVLDNKILTCNFGSDEASSHIYINDPDIREKHCSVTIDTNQNIWLEDHSSGTTLTRRYSALNNSKRKLLNGDTISLLLDSAKAHKLLAQKSFPLHFYEFVFIRLKQESHKNDLLCKGEINEKYEILEMIGSGTFATVYKGVHQATQEVVAIKIVLNKNLSTEPEKWKTQMKEIDMLKRVNHPNCVKLWETFQFEHEALYICMEFMAGGDLFDRIQQGVLKEEDTTVLTRRILEAVSYLHQKGIVHRDLKPENILLSHRDKHCLHAKVADFGVATLVSKNAGCKTVTGSMAYIAPEVLDRQMTTQGLGSYSFEVDMWSVGVLVYACLFAKLPFPGAEGSSNELRKAVEKMGQPKNKFAATLSPSGRNFLFGLLELNRQTRLTAKEALEHEWITTSPHCGNDESCGGTCQKCSPNHDSKRSKQEDDNE